MEMIKQHEGLMVFLAKVQELQNQFIDGCFEEDYNVAANGTLSQMQF